MLKSNKLREIGALALCAFLLPPALSAQAEGDDVYILEAFIVDGSAQRGYVSTNSASGTRLAQNVKELPIPVDIITVDFIEDIGALDVRDTLQFTAGLETEITSQQVGENTSNPNAFRLRGYVSEAVLRNGFRVLGATDTVNIMQVDVVRGPNALLYGIGNFGGVVNYVTARPTDEHRQNISLSFGSWDFYRAQVRARGPIAEQFGYSVGTFYQEGNTWHDHGFNKKYGYALMLEYRVTENTTVAVEFDHIMQNSRAVENPLSPNFLAFVEDGSFVDPTNFPDTVLRPDGSNVYENPANRRGFLARPDDGFRWGGRDTSNETDDRAFFLTLVHNFSRNLSFQAGYNRSERRIDNEGLTLNLTNTLAEMLSDSEQGRRLREQNPWMFVPQHPLYEDWRTPTFQALQYNWTKGESKETRDQFRVEFAYLREIFNVRNTFIGGMTYNRFHPNQGANYSLKDTSRAAVSPSVGDITGLQGAFPRFQSIYNLDPIRRDLSASEEFFMTQPDIRPSKFWERGYYLIHQARLFNEKVHTILGLRYDWIHTASSVRWNFDDDGFTPDKLSTVRSYRHRADGPSSAYNTSIGLSYTPIRELSLFVLTASALQPVYNQTNPTGNIPDPQTGRSYEVGVKYDLLDTRISGAISVYQIERDGVPVRTGAALYPRGNPNDPNVDPDWVNQGRGNPNDFGFKADKSQGVDTQVFFSDIIEGLQTVVNFSYNKYNWERLYGPSFVRKEGTGENAEFIFEEIDLSDTINRNRNHNDTPRFSFRVWNKYEFREGRLEGLDIGLGLNWTDRREATFEPALETLNIIPARTIMSAAMGYRREIKGKDVNIRLNVFNLLNDRDAVGYAYQAPRNYRVNVTIAF